MSFNPNEPRKEYIASSGQTSFPFNFQVFNDTDLVAYLTPVGQDADDTNDLLTITTDYTVTILGDSGGSIELTSGATSGDQVTITRSLPVDRNVEYQERGDLRADTLNDDQDYQTQLILDIQAKNSRYVQIPESAQGVDTNLPNPSPDNYIKWNTDGTALENDLTSPTWATAAENSANEAATSATISQLKAWEAEAEEKTANSYAVEPEDTFVKVYTSNGDGTFTATPTTDYSSLHWAAKAEDFGDSEFRDSTFRIFNDLDNTKKIAFQASGLSTATVRAITMPDFDVDLGNLVLLTSDQTIAGIKTFSSFPITPSSAPTTDYQIANKKYVDDNSGGALPSVTGTFTATNTTNNINLTGVGSLTDLSIGDVIQISGSTSNDGEYTVEVITDADNIIVNQAHAGGSTTKALVNEVSTASVTVSILAKWFNAPVGLGQGVVSVLSSRSLGVTYANNTNRTIQVSATLSGNTQPIEIDVDGEVRLADSVFSSNGVVTANFPIPIGSTYQVNAPLGGTLFRFRELR